MGYDGHMREMKMVAMAPDRATCSALRTKDAMILDQQRNTRSGYYGWTLEDTTCHQVVVLEGGDMWGFYKNAIGVAMNSKVACDTFAKQYGVLGGCKRMSIIPAGPSAQPPRGGTSAAPPATAAPNTEAALIWTPGDEWSYRWSSPQGSGTFVWVVDREEVVDSVPFYVIKSGTARETYYRKDDRAFFMDKINGQVELRNTPPVTYWSASPGAKEVRYTRERPIDRQTEEMALTCETGALEPLTVPAGTFDAVKVTCRNSRMNAISFELWLSRAVRHMVKEP